MRSVYSHEANIFALLEEVAFVEDKSHACGYRADAKQEFKETAIGRKIVLYAPHAAAERHRAGRGDEDDVKSFEGHR
jgi:hypothetical protein